MAIRPIRTQGADVLQRETGMRAERQARQDQTGMQQEQMRMAQEQMEGQRVNDVMNALAAQEQRQQRRREFEFGAAAKNVELAAQHGIGIEFGEDGAPKFKPMPGAKLAADEMVSQGRANTIRGLWPEMEQSLPHKFAMLRKSGLSGNKLASVIANMKKDAQIESASVEMLTARYPEMNPEAIKMAINAGMSVKDVEARHLDGRRRQKKEMAMQIWMNQEDYAENIEQLRWARETLGISEQSGPEQIMQTLLDRFQEVMLPQTALKDLELQIQTAIRETEKAIGYGQMDAGSEEHKAAQERVKKMREAYTAEASRITGAQQRQIGNIQAFMPLFIKAVEPFLGGQPQAPQGGVAAQYREHGLAGGEPAGEAAPAQAPAAQAGRQASPLGRGYARVGDKRVDIPQGAAGPEAAPPAAQPQIDTSQEGVPSGPPEQPGRQGALLTPGQRAEAEREEGRAGRLLTPGERAMAEQEEGTPTYVGPAAPKSSEQVAREAVGQSGMTANQEAELRGEMSPDVVEQYVQRFVAEIDAYEGDEQREAIDKALKDLALYAKDYPGYRMIYDRVNEMYQKGMTEASQRISEETEMDEASRIASTLVPSPSVVQKGKFAGQAKKRTAVVGQRAKTLDALKQQRPELWEKVVGLLKEEGVPGPYDLEEQGSMREQKQQEEATERREAWKSSLAGFGRGR